ncbi:hypothetical protein PXK58_00790 [Phaeobacter gallaeciensis]|uniref:hypothetical protein n=1 Tax=Phaeobacter gallaeciensis TaxID=60890 RepID=UPI002380B311|nr:hypothetical protein [Phaeobacter gallaeciensis]MDE4272978.1 hypothetical protein [Phaeobacter gallaeciensis]MDE4298069.1 hypothetical protein [Phaeobacter gallaeciensis]MDE5183257.1 hypothetical protein [Phaeobacter gallaeciensis]
MDTQTKDLEKRVAELEASLQNAYEWIAALGQQDATILQIYALQLSKVSGGKLPPPPGITDETVLTETKAIVKNAITLNEYLRKVDADRATTTSDPYE